jgi:hypothetical protein
MGLDSDHEYHYFIVCERFARFEVSGFKCAKHRLIAVFGALKNDVWPWLSCLVISFAYAHGRVSGDA